MGTSFIRSLKSFAFYLIWTFNNIVCARTHSHMILNINSLHHSEFCRWLFSSDCTSFFRVFASWSYACSVYMCCLDACCMPALVVAVVFLICAWNVISWKTYTHLRHEENEGKKDMKWQGRLTVATALMTATACVAEIVLEIVCSRNIWREKYIDRQQSHVHKFEWVVDRYT